MVKYLKELETILNQYQIDKNDVCIVGSAILALHEIRENNDVDIIVRKSVRKDLSLSHKSCKISKNIEIVGENWFFIDDNLTDDLILDNRENHLKNGDYKYVNLNLLLERKRSSNKEKDLGDVNLIEEFLS
tara:strand:- start:4766 stop:5158 length:393 start_codon:yes stop_codon:yes gene_type:complete